jgi:hypothetical protein
MLTVDCWLQVALRCKKIKEVRRLSISCKEIYNGLTSYDVYRKKFDRDFPDNIYHSWWSPLENYTLQSKYQGVMYSLIGLGNTDHVDGVLVKSDPVRESLLQLSSWTTNYSGGYHPYYLVRTDLNKFGLYVVYAAVDCEDLTHINTYQTKIDAKEGIKEFYNKYSNVADYYHFVVVKLDSMCFEFHHIKEVGANYRMFYVQDDLESMKLFIDY